MSGSIINSSINIQLPTTPPTDNAELYQQLNILYNSMRLLHNSLSDFINASTTGAVVGDVPPEQSVTLGDYNKLYAKAGQALAYGDVVYLKQSGSVLNLTAMKATADFDMNLGAGSVKQAQAWVSQIGGIALNARGQITLGPSICTAISGVVMGSHYWLQSRLLGSLVYGTIRDTPISNIVAGSVESSVLKCYHQYIGVGLAPGVLYFNPSPDLQTCTTPYFSPYSYL